MAFSSQMHNHIRVMRAKNVIKAGAVADVRLCKYVKGGMGNGIEIFQIGSIGQRIKVDHLMPLRHGQTHHCRPYEPRPACDQHFHEPLHSNGLSQPANSGAP